MSAAPDHVWTLPRDLQVGQAVLVNVPVFPHRHDMDCEIIEIEKVRRDGRTQYKVVVMEPREDIPNIPYGTSNKNRRSTRYFSPSHRVQVRQSVRYRAQTQGVNGWVDGGLFTDKALAEADAERLGSQYGTPTRVVEVPR